MFKKRKIDSFQKLTLSLSGMRISEEYEIVRSGNIARISRYTIVYSGGKDNRRLEQKADADCAEIVEILNACGVLQWDGFCGKNPPGVLDGTMFSLEAELNGGTTIRASGSNNFPKHYHDFISALREILRRTEE